MTSLSLIHVILVSFYTDVSQADREATLSEFRQLGNQCGGREAGILYWNAGWNNDQRKNFHVVAIGIFADNDVLLNYRIHPKHREFATRLSRIADWIVGDLEAHASEFLDGL